MIARILPEYTECCERCDRPFTDLNPQYCKDKMLCLGCVTCEQDYLYDMMRDLAMQEDYDAQR